MAWKLLDKKNRIKVLYLVSTLERGGPANMLYTLVKHLNRDYFYPVILTLSKEKKNSRLKDFLELGIRVETLGLSKISGMIHKKQLMGKISKEAPNIVHSHGFRADILNGSFHSCPFIRVSTVHNYLQIDYSMIYGRPLGYTMAKAHAKALRCIDCIIGVSYGVSKNLVMNFGINPRRVKTIQNFVDSKVFQPLNATKERMAIRKKYTLPERMLLFVYLGQLIRRKNVDMLVRAFSELFAERLDIGVVIAGSGRKKQHLIRQAANIANVFFLGYQSSPKEIFQLSDYYISASISEGLPMSVIEALACGLPVILSDIEPHREIAGRYGKAGVLFDPVSLYDLKSKIRRLLSYNYAKMRAEAIKLAHRTFSETIGVRAYEKTYLKLVKTGGEDGIS